MLRYSSSYIIYMSLVILMVIHFSGAYKKGAPADVCDDMTPQHGVPPQKLPSPYTITLNKRKIRPGEKIVVTIKSKDSNTSFKGFFLEARDNTDSIIGVFENVPDTKLVNCNSGTNNAITHNSPKEKSSITTTWTAPVGLKKSFSFILTTAKNGAEFWVGQKSWTVIVI